MGDFSRRAAMEVINAIRKQPDVTDTNVGDSISRRALLAEYDRLHVGEPGRARKMIEDAPSVTISNHTDELKVTNCNDTDLVSRQAILNLPSAQSEIIRCKDCRYWREHKYAKETKRYIPFCGFNAIYTEADDYCSKAERRKDG